MCRREQVWSRDVKGSLSFQGPNWVRVCSNLVKLEDEWTLRFYRVNFLRNAIVICLWTICEDLPSASSWGIVNITTSPAVRCITATGVSRCHSLWGGNWPSFSSKSHLGALQRLFSQAHLWKRWNRLHGFFLFCFFSNGTPPGIKKNIKDKYNYIYSTTFTFFWYLDLASFHRNKNHGLYGHPRLSLGDSLLRLAPSVVTVVVPPLRERVAWNPWWNDARKHWCRGGRVGKGFAFL